MTDLDINSGKRNGSQHMYIDASFQRERFFVALFGPVLELDVPMGCWCWGYANGGHILHTSTLRSPELIRARQVNGVALMLPSKAKDILSILGICSRLTSALVKLQNSSMRLPQE